MHYSTLQKNRIKRIFYFFNQFLFIIFKFFKIIKSNSIMYLDNRKDSRVHFFRSCDRNNYYFSGRWNNKRVVCSWVFSYYLWFSLKARYGSNLSQLVIRRFGPLRICDCRLFSPSLKKTVPSNPTFIFVTWPGPTWGVMTIKCYLSLLTAKAL